MTSDDARAALRAIHPAALDALLDDWLEAPGAYDADPSEVWDFFRWLHGGGEWGLYAAWKDAPDRGPMSFAVGDFATRDGTDVQIVRRGGVDGDNILVECVVAPADGWCSVGETEDNLATRYTKLVRCDRDDPDTSIRGLWTISGPEVDQERPNGEWPRRK